MVCPEIVDLLDKIKFGGFYVGFVFPLQESQKGMQIK